MKKEKDNLESRNVTTQFVVNWDDFKSQCPPPYSIKDGSKVAVKEYSGGTIKIWGSCCFPKDEPSLLRRNQVNHINLFDLMKFMIHFIRNRARVATQKNQVNDINPFNLVKFVLCIIWNTARITAQKFNWEEMYSVDTNSHISHRIQIGKDYQFDLTVVKMKSKNGFIFYKATLKITDCCGIEHATAGTTVAIKR